MSRRGESGEIEEVLENVVARDGIEPPTPAFSGLYSPIVNELICLDLVAEVALFEGGELRPE